MYEWEKGRRVPRFNKMMNISVYFGISLDCLVSGKAADYNILEERLSRLDKDETYEVNRSQSVGQLIHKFHSLSGGYKERLIGYLDGLCREDLNILK